MLASNSAKGEGRLPGGVCAAAAGEKGCKQGASGQRKKSWHRPKRGRRRSAHGHNWRGVLWPSNSTQGREEHGGRGRGRGSVRMRQPVSTMPFRGRRGVGAVEGGGVVARTTAAAGRCQGRGSGGGVAAHRGDGCHGVCADTAVAGGVGAKGWWGWGIGADHQRQGLVCAWGVGGGQHPQVGGAECACGKGEWE